MKAKYLCLLSLVALGLPLAVHASACNSAFVQQRGRTLTVLPTGVDDTANLQCAFDSASASGPGATVQLVEGTYKIRQIVVTNFVGAFIGAGAKKSLLTNLPNIYVNPNPSWASALPSASNPYPVLVSFIDSDFLVSDMGMIITGQQPTTGWVLPGLPPPLEFYELLCGFTFAGSKGNGVFLGVDIEGQDAPTLLTGYNVINGILFEGTGTGFDTAEQPITGSFVVTDSTFRSVDSATPSSNVQNSSILISRNTERDVGIGGELNGLLNSRYEYSFNTVQASTVYDPVYDVAMRLFVAVGQSQSLTHAREDKKSRRKCPAKRFFSLSLNHIPIARHWPWHPLNRRGATGEVGTSWNTDGARTVGLYDLEPRDALRPRGPDLAQPGSVRAFEWARLDAALVRASPDRNQGGKR